MPEISVIVPVYKVEAYLPICVESLLNQTFSDFELILVDDGSPDGCGEMCDTYARKDSRIRVIHQKNSGLSGARNRGIDEARGKYLCFVDSDDLVAPDYLEYLYGLLANHDADFSVCGSRRFQDTAELDTILQIPQTVEHLPAVDFFALQLTPKTEMGVWNKLFRRELFDTLRFEQGKLHEDILFSVGLAKICDRGVVFGNEQKHFYRQNPQGIMSQAAKKCSPDRVYASEKVMEFAMELGKNHLNACAQYALWHPWLFVDPIYVRFQFRENRLFLKAMQELLRKYLPHIPDCVEFPAFVQFRMNLFSKNRMLYGINAYARLLRVYLYRLLHKDAYADGHGI